MDARELLVHLQDLGMLVSIHGDTIKCERTKNAMTDDLRQLIHEHRDEIVELLNRAEQPKLDPPVSIYSCPQCGGTNWARTGVLPDGGEHWRCVDCPPAPDSAHSPECPMCGGAYLITDQAGKFCTDCRCRPWEKRESEPVPKPEPLAVRWGSAQGWLRLMNPLTGEVMEIPARGAPKWLFDRLSEQKRSPVRFEKAAQQPMPAVVEKPIVPPTSETEAFWRDDDDIPF